MYVFYDVEKSKGRENPKRNKSGCLDLTAYEAIRRADISMEHERLHRMIDMLHALCELNDFHIEEHVVLKDKRTGKVWR